MGNQNKGTTNLPTQGKNSNLMMNYPLCVCKELYGLYTHHYPFILECQQFIDEMKKVATNPFKCLAHHIPTSCVATTLFQSMSDYKIIGSSLPR